MNAMQLLLAKKRKAAAAKAASTTPAETIKTATQVALANVGPAVVTKSCAGKGLDMADLLNRASAATTAADSVSDLVKKREDSGIYATTDELGEALGSDGNIVMENLKQLDHALIAKTPSIGLLSIKIRKNLEQYPELTHILTDDQLGIICSGILTHANVATEPKTAAAKSAAANRKIASLSDSIDLDDI